VAACPVADAVEQARLALEFGARGLLFTPPFYLKGLDEEGLYAWFSQCFEAIGPDLRGVILYHIPGQTAVPLSVGLIARLRHAFPQAIIGIKDSSGDRATAEAFRDAHGDLAILIGDERLLARGMNRGAQGSICGLANIAPALLRKVVHEGRDDPRVKAAVDLIVSFPVMPAVKALVAHRHGDPEFARTRPPLVDLAPARARDLVSRFDAILETGVDG
jgi:4-hydroxy-tetrahydrodipicolinate synthase